MKPIPSPLVHRRPASAFTLIELLVVIGIISILIGMLLPSLAAARQQAGAVKCLSQIREVVNAASAFASDRRDQLPENRIATSPSTHITWRQFLIDRGYLPSGELWACPIAVSPPATELGTFDRGSECVGDVPSSYAYNGHLVWKNQPETVEAERDLVTIARPSHTIVLTETRAMFPDLRVTDGLLQMQPDDQGGFFGFWHPGAQGAYAFGDGHAEAQNLLDTGSPDCRWHNGADNTQDAGDPQTAEEFGRHAHPGWRFLVHPVYR